VVTQQELSICLFLKVLDKDVLIVAPPKAGKTVLLQDIANAITANHKKAKLNRSSY
jgi:stage III sporulation protein SpoIIIAA